MELQHPRNAEVFSLWAWQVWLNKGTGMKSDIRGSSLVAITALVVVLPDLQDWDYEAALKDAGHH
jgi:hypothetical protein